MTSTPLLTRRLLLVERVGWSGEERETAERLWRIPVLGLGAFGAQVLRSLAATRQTTALEWLPASADPWAVCAPELVFVVADWREAASARQAAHLAETCRAHGCLTIAVGPSPCCCPEHKGAAQAAQVIDGMADFLRPGLVCTDLADMRVLFTRSGTAMGGIGRASGRDRTPTALHRAVAGPCLDATTLALAQHVLLMVTASPDLTLHDIHEVAAQVQRLLSQDAWIVFGGIIDAQAPPETIQVMLLAGGIEGARVRRRRAGATVLRVR